MSLTRAKNGRDAGGMQMRLILYSSSSPANNTGAAQLLVYKIFTIVKASNFDFTAELHFHAEHVVFSIVGGHSFHMLARFRVRPAEEAFRGLAQFIIIKASIMSNSISRNSNALIS